MLPLQNRLKRYDNEEKLSILRNSRITGASPADFLMPYPGHSFGESYHSAKSILDPQSFRLVSVLHFVLMPNNSLLLASVKQPILENKTLNSK